MCPEARFTSARRHHLNEPPTLRPLVCAPHRSLATGPKSLHDELRIMTREAVH